MNYFLAKTDPETYSIDDLIREKKTVWNGIKSPQALRAIKAMRPGDMVFVYHSQTDTKIVGLMKVISEPRPDESERARIKAGEQPKLWVVDMQFVKKFEQPISLQEIKATHLFDEWSLVYQSRLSTMRVPDKFVEWVKKNWPTFL